MRTLRRRAAIGATSAALLFAAAGTSLAAVRAARYQGGVTGSGLALPPSDGGVTTDPGVTLPPAAGSPAAPEGSTPVPDAIDRSTELPPPAPRTGPAPTTDPSTESPSTGTTQAGGQPAASPAQQAGRVTVPTLGPATGPTPTLPIQPSITVPCPTDTGEGLIPRTGPLWAPDLWLPLPENGPLVLVPQASAPRPVGTPVGISWSSTLGDLGNASTLALPRPLPTEYELNARGVKDRGWIRFLPAVSTSDHVLQACRDRSFVLYTIGKTPGPIQLRIVGYVAPAGAVVTIDEGGGTARLRVAAPGTHRVNLLTANDSGGAGPLVTITIQVR